jgi:hypothetical protein
MQVTDEGELWALCCAILECKFGERSCPLELAGSATLGQVIDRLLVDLRQCRVFLQATNPPAGLRSWDEMLALNPESPGWKRMVEWDKARKTAARRNPEAWRILNPERPEWKRVRSMDPSEQKWQLGHLVYRRQTRVYSPAGIALRNTSRA